MVDMIYTVKGLTGTNRSVQPTGKNNIIIVLVLLTPLIKKKLFKRDEKKIPTASSKLFIIKIRKIPDL